MLRYFYILSLLNEAAAKHAEKLNARNPKYFAINLFIFFPGPLKKINSAVASGNAVTIYWPEASVSVDKYVIKYRVKGSTDEWTKKETERIFIKIIGLDYGAEYEFQVYYVQGSNEIPHTEIRDVEVPDISKFDIYLLGTAISVGIRLQFTIFTQIEFLKVTI